MIRYLLVTLVIIASLTIDISLCSGDQIQSESSGENVNKKKQQSHVEFRIQCNWDEEKTIERTFCV